MNQMNHVIKCIHFIVFTFMPIAKNAYDQVFIRCNNNWTRERYNMQVLISKLYPQKINHVNLLFFSSRIFALFKSMLRSRWMTESGKCDIVSCRFTTSWDPCCTIGKLEKTRWFPPHSICLRPDFHSAILMARFFHSIVWSMTLMVHWPAKSDHHISLLKVLVEVDWLLQINR